MPELCDELPERPCREEEKEDRRDGHRTEKNGRQQEQKCRGKRDESPWEEEQQSGRNACVQRGKAQDADSAFGRPDLLVKNMRHAKTIGFEDHEDDEHAENESRKDTRCAGLGGSKDEDTLDKKIDEEEQGLHEELRGHGAETETRRQKLDAQVGGA